MISINPYVIFAMAIVTAACFSWAVVGAADRRARDRRLRKWIAKKERGVAALKREMIRHGSSPGDVEMIQSEGEIAPARTGGK